MDAIKFNKPQQNTETSKLQDFKLWKKLFKKQQDSVSIQRRLLKFPYLLYLQNCPFMSQIEANQRLANSFVVLRRYDAIKTCR